MWKKRAALERQRQKQDLIDTIRPSDIILGRGRGIQESPGNIKLREIVATYKDRYEKAGRAEKTQMTEDIVMLVKNESGRFLKKTVHGFEEVDFNSARLKVSHIFRDLKKPKVAKCNSRGTSTGTPASKRRKT